MLQSPGIELIESTVTPATETVANTNGVATIGYSTKGPINELVRISSLTEFNNVFGEPVKDLPYSHILARSALANGSVVYFMRIADDTASEATCAVDNGTETYAQIAFTQGANKEFSYTSEDSENLPDTLTFTINSETCTIATRKTDSKAFVTLAEAIDALTKKFTRCSFLQVSETSSGVTTYGILVTAKSKTFSFSSYNAAFGVETEPITKKTTGSFAGYDLAVNFGEPTLTTDKGHFLIQAKYAGTGMNGVSVVKSSYTSSLGTEYWNVRVIEKSGNVLESFSNLTKENFINEIEKKSDYISITESVEPSTGTLTWDDGTYVLGKGRLLKTGEYTSFTDETYSAKEGSNGTGNEISYQDVADLHEAALGNYDFKNRDEFSFSILATPCCQHARVQEAAVAVCQERGDAIYLADTFRDSCEAGKDGIDDIVEWSNSNPGAFQSSYCAIYYGWFSQMNPYDTANDIVCPASVFIAPKMLLLDRQIGEFYAPAGTSNGSIVVSDFIYSPDQEDRDKLVGNDHVVNPIIFSNTRGVMAFAQKTCDRTTSPLNRVGIRRMTNAIKRALRANLQDIMFTPNNEAARGNARRIIDGIMSPLQNSGCIEYYSSRAVSGTGSQRNELNLYIDFAPFGLIEKIYVYVNISEAGITVTEVA